VAFPVAWNLKAQRIAKGKHGKNTFYVVETVRAPRPYVEAKVYLARRFQQDATARHFTIYNKLAGHLR
jgi:hypothetical protein